MQKRSLALLTFLVLVLTFAVSGLAQTSKGIIAGTVTDNTGAVVIGARITATNVDTAESRTVESGPTGAFRIEAVNIGKYKLSISYQGFQTQTLTGVEVAGSVVTPVDIRLQVAGAVSTEVTVTAENNQIETETGQISGTISTSEITNLPLASLNPIELALTQPGVVDTAGRSMSNGVGFSVNGTRPRGNNFLIDGQDNNDNSIQGQAFQPANPNAVQEVAVLTNSYSAEFGRGGSSVTNVIFRSGTNKFHGNAWERYEGSGLNAVDAADAINGVTSRTKARYDTHTFGFTFGGPLIKDKLFFFGSSQWQRTYGNETASYALPTDAGVAQLQEIGTPNANLLLQYAGSLRGSTTAGHSCQRIISGDDTGCIDFGYVQRAVSEKSTDTQWNFKVDYLPRQTDSIAVRYLHDRGFLSPDFFANPGTLPGFDTYQGGPSENLGLTWTHTFNSRTINEFRASWGHFSYDFFPTTDTTSNPLYSQESIYIANITNFPLLGTSSGFPQARGHSTYQFQDALTMTRGKHVIKVGADVARLIVHDVIPINLRGEVDFSSGGGYTALGNFLDDYTGGSGAAFKDIGNTEIRPRMWQHAYYLEDTWKVKSNLTLDLGIRYEFQNNPENYLPYPGVNLLLEPSNQFPYFAKVKEDGNNWAPRFGFAYTPHIWTKIFGQDKTVIRGGFGMFYDSFYTNILDNTASSSPNAVSGQIQPADTTGRGLASALSLPATVMPVVTPFDAVTTVADNLVNPTVLQWNVDVERELPWNLLWTTAYVGTRGERLFINDELNPGTGFDQELNNLPRFNPNRGSITVRDNGADSVYHGLSFKVERRFARGVMLRSSYTYSHAIDNGSEVFTLAAGSSVPQTLMPGQFGRQLERGNSAYDVRHRWALAYEWDLPGFRSENKGLDAFAYLTRHWQWTGTTSLQTGVPTTVYVGGFDSNGDLRSGNNRPDLGNPNAPLNSVGIAGAWLGDPTPGALYSLTDFSPVTTNDVHWIVPVGSGNVGRNTYFEPGQINFTIAAGREFPIPHTEGQKISFRMEFYNPFNHPNEINGVNTNVFTAINADETLFNTQYARIGARQIKFQLKYDF